MAFRNGTLYFTANGRIRKVTSSGVITTIAGNGGSGWVADGTPALAAPLDPHAITFGPHGNLYVADDQEVLRLNADNTFTRILGVKTANGVYGIGRPALQASADAANGLAFDAKDDLYIAGFAAKNLLMIDPHGILHLIGSLYPRTEGGLITGPHGTVIASDTRAVDRLSPSRIEPISSFGGSIFDGVHSFSPNGITISPTGTIYIDTFGGNGYSSESAIAAINPNGTSFLLWEQHQPPSQG